MTNEQIAEKLSVGKSYSRQQIYNMMHEENPSLSRNSFNWIISSMVKEQTLAKQQRGLYSLFASGTKKKQVYHPVFSEMAATVARNLESRFPLVEFTCFESSQLNEFLNQLIAQNTCFIMVERDVLDSVFRYLQAEGFRSLLLKPTVKEWDSYWTGESIILLNRVSEAPKNRDVPHGMSLEQLLVDMLAEKTMRMLCSKSEIQGIYNAADERYQIDWSRLLRYARRRGKAENVKKYMELL